MSIVKSGIVRQMMERRQYGEKSSGYDNNNSLDTDCSISNVCLSNSFVINIMDILYLEIGASVTAKWLIWMSKWYRMWLI